MKPVHIYEKLRYLVPSELESRLRGAKIYTFEHKGWSEEAKREGLFLDLSRIEWIDIGALVQTVLLSEAARRDGIDVTVALPLARARRSEEFWARHNSQYAPAVYSRIARRAAASDFLKYLRVTSALQADHLGEHSGRVIILDDFDPSAFELAEEEEVERYSNTEKVDAVAESEDINLLYQYIFPLTWFSSADPTAFAPMVSFLSAVIGEAKRGIDAVDAAAISNVILYELVENVVEHSGTGSRALVAAWARPETCPPRPSNCLPAERAYICWLLEKNTSLVDLIVGDSGEGIPKKLRKAFRDARSRGEVVPDNAAGESANVMLWSFERWSTSKDATSLRGTRGLYRVDRIVRKYQGIITARAENQFVGWDHGGLSFDEKLFNSEGLARIPGTVLRLRVPPLRETYPSRMSNSERQEELALETLRLGVVEDEGMNVRALHYLKTALSRVDSTHERCFIGVFEGGTERREAIEKALRQAVEMRHPGSLILFGLPGGWEFIDNAIDSVNAEHERTHRYVESFTHQHFQIWDPVLVIGPQGQAEWVGATETEQEVLNLLLRDGPLTDHRLRTILPETDKRLSFLAALRNDTHLIGLRPDHSLELRIGLPAVARHISASLRAHVARSGPGVVTNGYFRAPSLHRMRKWLDVPQILQQTCGADLAMLAVSLFIQEHECWAGPQKADFMLGDTSTASKHLRTLSSCLGIDRSETISAETGIPVAPTVRVIQPDARVLLYMDVIASGETVERYVRLVLRGAAHPIAVACLFDVRETRDPAIEIWGIKVPIIALTHIPLIADHAPAETSFTNINPVTRRPEQYNEPTTERLNDASYPIGREALNELIIKHNALQFNHIGRPIGRHFTFYVDANKLLDETLVFQIFNSEINAWINHSETYVPESSAEKLEIWHPAQEPRTSATARYFAEELASQRKDTAVLVRTIHREPAHGLWYFGSQESPARFPNVVVLDWGSLTGTTVMQMLRVAAEAGVQRILVAVLLSQLPIEEERFLRSLKSLRVPYKPGSESDVDFLPGFIGPEDHQETNGGPSAERLVDVKVVFLSRFPITAYDRHECPVCQQLSRLSQEHYPTALLSDFAAMQERRLRLRPREEALRFSPANLDGQPFDGAFLIRMARFREELASALVSTSKRQSVLEHISQIVAGMQDPERSRLDDALALISFLSVESQWLRRPPLHFNILRRAIASLCLAVAMDTRRSETDRLNAVTLLRTSSKKLFAEQLPSLFRSMMGSERLHLQLLYDAFTYVMRPYHQAPAVFEPLRNALRDIEEGITGGSLLSGGPQPNSIAETVHTLRVRAEAELAIAGVRLDTPPHCWAQLRLRFNPENYRKHDSVPTSILFMQPGPERAAVDNAIKDGSGSLPVNVLGWLKSLADYWTSCCEFLDYEILPLLTRLRSILLSDDGRSALGEDSVIQLVEYLDKLHASNIPLAESSFSQLVARIRRDPSTVLSRDMWQRYKATVSWFRDILLRSQGDTEGGSRLIRFLQSAPAPLALTVTSVYDTFRDRLPSNHTIDGLAELRDVDVKVFCTEKLLRESIMAVLDNIISHTVNPTAGVHIWVSAAIHGREVWLRISNNLTRPSYPEGVGLSLIAARLTAFGASLEREPRPKDPQLSYEVRLHFVQGE